jgi:hypothetical protein
MKWWRRTTAERALIWRTASLFLMAHALLRFRRLDTARTSLTRAARVLRVRAQDPQQLSWAINAVNRNLPGHHSCLVDAVCCEAIAHNSGISTELKLGAARSDERMRFHAWVEHAGRMIAGAHDGEFKPLR